MSDHSSTKDAHTPGPWDLGEVHIGVGGHHSPNEAFVTAGELDEGGYCEFRIQGENAIANARLIAAAPDMREAGQELAAAACDIHPTAPSSASINRLHVAMDAWWRANAKATGQQLRKRGPR
ncbi:MAG TPA: hypothetical protein VJ063_12030 [Verrucomicrobiae bacterium]|nr:hypothetical protein [Verrucomicrobiae bacterium]